MADRSGIASLSFARTSPRGIDLWPPLDRSGGWSADNQAGAARAAELLDYMAREQAPCALGHVAAAIGRHDSPTPGLEAGFWNAVGMAALGERVPAVEQAPAAGRPVLHLAISN